MKLAIKTAIQEVKEGRDTMLVVTSAKESVRVGLVIWNQFGIESQASPPTFNFNGTYLFVRHSKSNMISAKVKTVVVSGDVQRDIIQVALDHQVFQDRFYVFK